jgi:acyl-homoserine lactone acylase PvdQ
VQVIHDLLAADAQLSPDELRATEYRLGVVDQRAPEFLPMLTRLRGTTASQEAALALLRAWDGTAYGPGAGTSEGDYTDESVTDGPAPTLFRRLMDDLRDEVLAELPDEVVLESDEVASHVWDASPADNLVLRALDPSRSTLTPSRDYLGGRTPDAVLLAALDTSIAALTDEYGADPAGWRAQHPRRPIESLTGVIGPSLTMPYQDRGSWVHVVAFRGAAPPPPGQAPPADGRAGGRSLAATGTTPLPAVLGLALVLGAGLVRRTRGRRAPS